MQVVKAVKPSAIFVAVQNLQHQTFEVWKDIIIWNFSKERTVSDLSLQCWKLDENYNNFSQKKKKTQKLRENAAYDKRLINVNITMSLIDKNLASGRFPLSSSRVKAIEHDQTKKSKAR